ncbi:MAG: Glu-tRNA(Gln) amidotransferase subunit GatE [Halococcoides sp.]
MSDASDLPDPEDLDYEALGLTAGLEIHQQLDTATKLFCQCPTRLRDPEASERRIHRYLHPTKSELGEIDAAALEESAVEREFEYLSYDSTCLVEEDDEPPHRVDAEAIEVVLQIAALLDMDPVDQIHTMRKIVIDGSNTSGFQRTMLVAMGGQIETPQGPVGIDDLMLEEESAQRVAETDHGVRYSLDRLGIPLVEIGTDPDISSPEQARAAAERIGMLLRSTGNVKRGLGTIRQDVNVSIAEGARIEMKGVQSLDDIETLVRNEVRRQAVLLEIADDLQTRDASVGEPRDVTSLFEDTESGVIAGAIESGGEVQAVRLAGFDGLLGREVQPDHRLGTECADHARRHGAGGLFHTDELPAYGVTEAEVEALRAAVAAGPDDAVALVADDPETARTAIEAAADRARAAIEGVPEETRDANPDGTSSYLRPLPGSARMYPETDVPPVDPDPGAIETPELLTEKVDRYVEAYDLASGLAEQVAYGQRWTVFEESVERGVDPALAARTVESTVTELRREDVPVEALDAEHFLAVLEMVADDELASEGVPDLLEALAESPGSDPRELAEEAGLGSADEGTVREAVERVVERNADQVEAEGMAAFSGLMGECMGELRGKADGDLVSDVLREAIQQRAN